jgi:hypothetical protein
VAARLVDADPALFQFRSFAAFFNNDAYAFSLFSKIVDTNSHLPAL